MKDQNFSSTYGTLYNYNGDKDYGTIYLPELSVKFSDFHDSSLVQNPLPKEQTLFTQQNLVKTNIIQEAPQPKTLGIINYSDERSFTERKRFGRALRPVIGTLSTGFIALSIFGLLTLFWPVLVQELRYDLITSHESNATNQQVLSGFPSGDQWTPINTIFSIVVPKIDAKAPIIANVDSSDETSYMDALKKGVAHAKGTCFPGMNCRMYLFAHSTNSPINVSRYNAVFYLLRKLENGDQIVIYYYGKKYLYGVTGKMIVSASDTQYITEKGDSEELILQTCDPPGTSLNRLLVFAKPRLVEYIQ